MLSFNTLVLAHLALGGETDLVIESSPLCGAMIIHNACTPPRTSGALPDGTKSTSRFNEYLQDINTTAAHVAQRHRCFRTDE